MKNAQRCKHSMKSILVRTLDENEADENILISFYLRRNRRETLEDAINVDGTSVMKVIKTKVNFNVVHVSFGSG